MATDTFGSGLGWSIPTNYGPEELTRFMDKALGPGSTRLPNGTWTFEGEGMELKEYFSQYFNREWDKEDNDNL